MDQNFINERIEEFSKNVRENGKIKNIDQHNLYYLQTTDMDGNITGEAFGANLMTIEGLKLFAGGRDNTRYGVGVQILLGSGQTTPTITDTTLTNLILQSGDISIYDSSIITNHRYWYDNTRQLLCVRCRYAYYSFPYTEMGTASGQTSVDLYEIGLMKGNYYGYPVYPEAYTKKLATHSLIYDKYGNPFHITKRNTEMLTIHIYLVATIDTHMFEDNYDNGRYITGCAQK